MLMFGEKWEDKLVEWWPDKEKCTMCAWWEAIESESLNMTW